MSASVDCELSSGWSKWIRLCLFGVELKLETKDYNTNTQNGGTPCGNLSESKNKKDLVMLY